MIELYKLVFGDNLLETACLIYITYTLFKVARYCWLKYLMHKPTDKCNH